MAKLGSAFNATDHDTEQRDYEELPNGIYKLEIESSEIKEGQNGTGLSVTNNVVDPEEYAGRKLFNYYNLEHKNQQAQEIGNRQFASLCRAVGIDAVEDSDELHFLPYTAKVGLGKPSKDGQYPARAEIKRYYFPDEGDVPEPSVDAVQPNKPAAQAKPATQQRTATAEPKPRASRPWGK